MDMEETDTVFPPLDESLEKYAEWLEKEEELEIAADKTQEQFVRDLPDCKVEYGDSYYLQFERRQKQEWNAVKWARIKLISAWIWMAIFGVLAIASIVSMITSGGESILAWVGLPVGFFGVLFCWSSLSSKKDNYYGLKNEYLKNEENLQKAQRWQSYVAKFTSQYLESVKQAEEDLEKLREEMETLRVDWQQIPKNKRYPEYVRKIAKQIEYGEADTISEAIYNIKEEKRIEDEKDRPFRVCRSCWHYSKCQQVGTPNCAAYMPK